MAAGYNESAPVFGNRQNLSERFTLYIQPPRAVPGFALLTRRRDGADLVTTLDWKWLRRVLDHVCAACPARVVYGGPASDTYAPRS